MKEKRSKLIKNGIVVRRLRTEKKNLKEKMEEWIKRDLGVAMITVYKIEKGGLIVGTMKS